MEASATDLLRAALAHLEEARGYARSPRVSIEEAERMQDLNASADAELCAACAKLDEPPPPVELIPTFIPPEQGWVFEYRWFWRRWEVLLEAYLRARRVRRWIDRRTEHVARLLDKYGGTP